ncbi:polyprenol monophosphomannose synthase [Nitrospina gracilis]|uniref:polyprenol monophosphomannose synthase n=1 Tax=Nitrospina gracilis TaxID=35801 RepID=UPI001F3D4CC6|nr:polyprenol monophosphomannose synthase [Nitrospina gracilis]MCF8719857.1 dolichol-phosphate mannosyltransferase [Nitrospina gracilis Nb-211]
MARILVFTATYNEADNIEALIEGIRRYVADADILVVDDASPDGTGDLLDRLAEREKKLHVVHRPGKLGLGTAHLFAMQFAILHDYDILITMDADFSHNPQYLPTLLKLMEENDFVIGSRYISGGRCDYGFVRTLVSRTANTLVHLLLNIPTHETTTSYRGFRVSLLKRMDLNSLRSEGYSFFMESIFLVHRATKKMAEFPIHFEDRRAGQSKISKREIIKAMLNLLRVAFRRCFVLPWSGNHRHAEHPLAVTGCKHCQSPHSMELARNETLTRRKCLHCGYLFDQKMKMEIA